MPHYIAHEIGPELDYGRKENKQQHKQKNIQHLNLKAPSNNVKIQSNETLTTQIYFFVATKQMRFYINETK